MESDVKITITINVGAEGLTVANYAEAAMGDRVGFSTGCTLTNYPVAPGTYDLVPHGRVEELERQLSDCDSDLGTANATIKKLEKENAELRKRLDHIAKSNPMYAMWNDPAEGVWDEIGKETSNDDD